MEKSRMSKRVAIYALQILLSFSVVKADTSPSKAPLQTDVQNVHHMFEDVLKVLDIVGPYSSATEMERTSHNLIIKLTGKLSDPKLKRAASMALQSYVHSALAEGMSPEKTMIALRVLKNISQEEDVAAVCDAFLKRLSH
jgi:hypothetical protein